MKTISLTKNQITLVDDEDYERLNAFKWRLHSLGYAIRSIEPKGIHKTLMLHRIIMDTPSTLVVDHINGNKLDNQKVNLRNCTIAQNQRNRRLGPANTSGYKGVIWGKREQKWLAVIKKEGKQKWLGTFADKNEAALAYNRAATKMFGEFANLNRLA